MRELRNEKFYVEAHVHHIDICLFSMWDSSPAHLSLLCFDRLALNSWLSFIG